MPHNFIHLTVPATKSEIPSVKELSLPKLNWYKMKLTEFVILHFYFQFFSFLVQLSHHQAVRDKAILYDLIFITNVPLRNL